MNGLYSNLKPKKKSVQRDKEILQETYQLFCNDNNRKSFKFNDHWKDLSCSLKYQEFKAKLVEEGRTKTKTQSNSDTTSSDACVGLDLNEDDEFELEEIVQVMGRDKAKREGKWSSSNASEFNGESSEMRKISTSVE